MTIKAYGAYAADKPLEAMNIERRALGPHDVQIDIAYCGVCHSDLHTVRSEWRGTLYPCVPGHEIVGQVTAVGRDVTKFKLGDTVGVGCMVNSCQLRRCGTGTSVRAGRWASSASAGSATWASSSPTRWARTWSRSPDPRASGRTRTRSARTKW